MKNRLTTVEKVVAALMVVCLILAVVFGYAAVHFFSKIW